jgi:DNA-binding winged helix-turn-helix (wHTH) protein
MSSKQTDQSIDLAGCSYQFGRFRLEIDAGGSRLFSDKNPVALSTAESTILQRLLEKHGEFVKTEELLKSISPSSMASENLVHGAVRGLRRTLNDADLIKNERSRGYCFTGEVERNLRNVSRPVLSEATTAIPNLSNASISALPATVYPVKGPDSFVVVALLVTAPVVLLPFGLVFFGDGNWDSLPRQLGFIQALMILVALAYDFYFSADRDLKNSDTETRRATLAVQQLRRFWRLLLASWCCLYITLPFSQWLGPPASGQSPSSQWQALQIAATFLNNSSALMLVLCYVVLNRPTVIKVADREIDGVSLKPGLFLVVGVALLEALLVALAGRFGLPVYAGDVLFAFDLLSGVAGGIAMALCISRLDSRLLGTSGLLPIIPIVLYFYVVLQPFYPLINRTIPNRLGVNRHFDLWVMQLAFMLKAVMYIYVTRLFRTERFLFYMIHARRVYENVETEWSRFKSARNSPL